jgi:transcriptional regulator with XRE-family HTH domain
VGSGDIQVRQMVGTRLRQMRLRANLTQDVAAHAIGRSVPAISRLEHGIARFRRDDLLTLLTLYGVTDPLQQDLLISVATGRTEPGWWWDDAVPLEDSVLWAHEQQAAQIRTYQPFLIPDLLRTEEYARAAHLARHYPAPACQATETAVKNALRRQEQRTARLWAVIDEPVLWRPIGGDVTVHVRQLDALIAVAGAPDVTIQILPLDAPLAPAVEPFTIFSLPTAPPVLAVHSISGDQIGELAAAERYGLRFDQIAGTAAFKAETPSILSRIRDHLSRLLGAS